MPPTNHVTIQGRRLDAPRHICCFFDTRDQQYETLIPYFAEGLANGEQVLTVMDSDLMTDHVRRLTNGGLPVEAAQKSGQMSSYCTDDTYLKGGRFAKDRMLEMLGAALKESAKNGFKRLRTCGDMAWTLRNMPGTGEVVEYESEVNLFLNDYDASFLCLYDASQISGSTMRDVLNTHSHVLMNGLIYENPYYLSPSRYRKTLLARRADTARTMGEQA